MNNLKNNGWLVCLIASLFFFYEFIQMSVFNAIGSELLKNFSVTVVGLANIAAAYSYSMILFLIPAGILLDTYSPKKIMLMAFTLSVTGTILFSFSKTASTAELCRLLSGVGGAFAFLSCIKLAVRWFPANKMSLVIGLMTTMAFFGGAIAQTPFTLLVLKWGWEAALRILAAVGLLFIFLISVFVSNQPGHLPPPSFINQPTNAAFFQRLLKSLLNIQTWLGAVYIALMNLPVVLLGTLWGNLYLTQEKHFTSVQASLIDTALFIGIMIGSPLVGFISDRIGKRKAPLIMGALLTFLCCLLLFSATTSIITCAVIFFLLGFFSSAQNVAYPAIVENNAVDAAGTASGIASIIIMGGGASAKIIYAQLLNAHWQGTTVHGLPFYSPHAFSMAMMMFPVSIAIAFFSALLVRETFCRRS